MKGGELAKRHARAAQATENLAKAKEAGNQEDVEKFTKQTVRATRQQSLDCKRLLTLMGVPVVDAPCEAESSCAALCAAGKVFAVGTEDMDALTFRTPKLLRKLTYSQAGGKGKDGKAKEKQPVIEIDCEKMLSEMKLSYDQFVDLCILCGCDYCSTIKGIGPKTGTILFHSLSLSFPLIVFSLSSFFLTADPLIFITPTPTPSHNE
jgi:flap endonuclease-1